MLDMDDAKVNETDDSEDNTDWARLSKEQSTPTGHGVKRKANWGGSGSKKRFFVLLMPKNNLIKFNTKKIINFHQVSSNQSD